MQRLLFSFRGLIGCLPNRFKQSSPCPLKGNRNEIVSTMQGIESPNHFISVFFQLTGQREPSKSQAHRYELQLGPFGGHHFGGVCPPTTFELVPPINIHCWGNPPHVGLTGLVPSTQCWGPCATVKCRYESQSSHRNPQKVSFQGYPWQVLSGAGRSFELKVPMGFERETKRKPTVLPQDRQEALTSRPVRGSRADPAPRAKESTCTM